MPATKRPILAEVGKTMRRHLDQAILLFDRRSGSREPIEAGALDVTDDFVVGEGTAGFEKV
jgi:hypothetical protein